MAPGDLDDISLLIQESLSARLELAKSQAIVHAEEERVAQAGALPDPMLQIGIQNDGFTSIEIGRMGTSFVSFMASQTFPWPGKRGLQRDVAELGATQAREVVARCGSRRRRTSGAPTLLIFRDRLALLDQLEAIWQKSFGVPRTWKLLKAVGVLLEGTPRDVNLAAIREAVGSLAGVAGVHDLHVWSLTSGVNAMSVHVVRANEHPHDEILERVQRHVRQNFKVSHVTVQVESKGCAEHEVHL